MSDPIRFAAVPHSELDSMTPAYLGSLVAPLDGMWEAFGKMAQAFEMRLGTRRIGFYILNDEGLILQCHVSPDSESHAASAFAALRGRAAVSGAMVSTADPNFMVLCLDAQLKMKVHSFLYTEHRPKAVVSKDLQKTSITIVKACELPEIAELQRHSLDQDPGEWLTGYLENLIAREELYALRKNEEILATGEIRVSDSQTPYADLGVITPRRFRGQGVASYLLSRLAGLCLERGLRPICSTTVENVASQHAIANAGFLPRHRLLDVQFG